MVRDCKARDAIVPSNLAGTVQILWVILIGSVAGVIAKFITPGENEPMGSSSPRYLEFIGALVATYLGQIIGWYGPDQSAD
jgi:uncharacterized membrane protein YeaQ/YmgE (transglycosylase-associated protein family)